MNVQTAGGIIVRDSAGTKEILLIIGSRRRDNPEDRFNFPKGHIDPGENAEQAALREVEEETGMRELRIIKKLGVMTRPSVTNSGEPVTKDIHLYEMKGSHQTSDNIDELPVWVPLKQAAEKLYFKEEADFLRQHLSDLLE